MDNEDPKAIAAAVRDLAMPVIASLSADLVDVEVQGQRGRRVVRVVVDGDDGVDIDVMAQASRLLSEQLDLDEELIAGAWTLEVTSPGIERPLSEPRHFARSVGRAVLVVHDKDGESRETEGKLAEASDDEIKLNVKGRMVAIPIASIVEARVVLPW